MIVFTDRVLVGRGEAEGVRNRLPLERARWATERVGGAYREKFPGQTGLLWGHNVAALVGAYGRWWGYEWQTWDELGQRVDPVLSGLVRWDRDGLRVVPVPTDDPWVLHGSWRVVGADDEVVDSGVPLSPDLERLRNLGLRLEAMGVSTRPEARHRLGFERSLREEGWRIEGWDLVRLGRRRGKA